MLLYLLSILLVLSCHATDPKSRVKDTLSDEDHGDDQHHNPDYDHEAFLGKEEAKTFDHLTPEESKEKLAKIFDQVDAQIKADGFVTEEELNKWILIVQNRYMIDDADKQMKQNDENNNGFVTWYEYKKNTLGAEQEDEGDKENYDRIIFRDEQRFKLADGGRDDKLDKEEFSAFLFPENHEHMKDVVINETLHDIDRDKDGFITLEEYLVDLWPEENRNEAEPDWVKNEKAQFSEYHDTNKDGKLDREEVKVWVLPPDDHVSSEAKHLISESDTSKDGKISKEEMIEKYDLFVGSQVTDYGEILRGHEEL